MLNEEFELSKKKRHNTLTTKEIWVGNVKRFVLSNKETIIYKREDRNRNFEVFLLFFQKYERLAINIEPIK